MINENKPYCFGSTKEFNEKSPVCKGCGFRLECKRKAGKHDKSIYGGKDE